MATKETATTKTVSSTTKLNVTKYLYVRPQKSGIAALMKKLYASEVHTLAEWDTILENLLNRKVTC